MPLVQKNEKQIIMRDKQLMGCLPGKGMKSIYYICGPDGSGKTTQCDQLIKDLRTTGIQVRHLWLRYPKILSKPLMAYCRLVGLTKYWHVDSVRVGVHEFYRSWFVSHLYPWLQLIDLKIMAFLKLRLPGLFSHNVIVMDRFAIDTLVDVMTDTRRYDLLSKAVGRGYVNTLPRGIRLVVLNVSPLILKKRRKDVEHDVTTEERLRLFVSVAQHLHIPIINADNPTQEVYREIRTVFLNK